MLYGFTGESAGYPVSTTTYGAGQTTISLTQEILAQAPDSGDITSLQNQINVLDAKVDELEQYAFGN
jgi:hypothetical protein